jgi:hypothetical protein
VTLSDFIEIFDSSALPLDPLQVLFYHVLDLADLNVPHLEAAFRHTLSPLLPDTYQSLVRAAWAADNLGCTSGAGLSSFRIIQEFSKQRS